MIRRGALGLVTSLLAATLACSSGGASSSGGGGDGPDNGNGGSVGGSGQAKGGSAGGGSSSGTAGKGGPSAGSSGAGTTGTAGTSGTGNASGGSTQPASPIPMPPAVELPPADMSGALRWSDPKTWPNNTVPPAGATVVVPTGKTILLDVVTPNLKSVTINGTLVGDQEKDIGITADWILVKEGRFQIGTTEKPFTRSAVITLTGNSPNDTNEPGMGNKLLGVLNGVLELHGAPVTAAWTQLDADAAVGATSVTLASEPGWKAGDKLVIATSSPNRDEYDVVTVASATGKQVSFKEALKFKHVGTTVTPVPGVTVDTRTEIGLLTHNIVVKGDDSSVTSKIGGHAMFMATPNKGSTVQITNTEFTAMGQFNNLGRYPVHFHVMQANCKGCYIKSSAVHDTVQRGIVVHDSSVTVEDNVIFNTVGHNVIVETPTTEGALLNHNLALVNRPPTPAFTEDTLVSQNDKCASNFWMKSTRNRVTNNVSAGAFSAGFIYDGSPSTPAYFSDNRAHAAMDGGCDAFPTGAGFTAILNREGDATDVLQNFTVYHSKQGYWPELEKEPRATEITKPIIMKNLVAYENDIAVFGRGPGNKSVLEKPFIIGGAGVFNQYGGDQTLIEPTFVNTKGSAVTGHDTTPNVASFTLIMPKFINAPKIVPDLMSWMVYMDDMSVPKGAYVSSVVPFHAAPECTSVSFGEGKEGTFFKCPRRYGYTELDIRDLAAPSTPLHDKMKITRSDGLNFYSLGYQGGEIKWVGGNRGYSAIFDAGLSYNVDTVSAKGYALRLADRELEAPNSKILAETATLQVSVNVNGPPKSVFRKGTGSNPDTTGGAADALKSVGSKADLEAAPLTSYFYDASAKKVWVQISPRWVSIVP